MRRKYLGHPLVALLARSLTQEGQSVTRLAAEVGISQSYLSELLVGDKQFSKLDDEIVRAIAAHLKIPAVVALLMAGKLRHQDFVDRPMELDEMLEEAVQRIGISSYALESAVTPPMLTQLPSDVKLLLVLIFQAATGNVLIPQRRWPWTQAGTRRD